MAWHRGSDICSAAGHEISETGAGVKHLPDCPACTYGTLDECDTPGMLACIDCGVRYSREQLVKLRVLPQPRGGMSVEFRIPDT